MKNRYSTAKKRGVTFNYEKIELKAIGNTGRWKVLGYWKGKA
jgi:hypothetical protein